MCDCASLPIRWWANDDSNLQAINRKWGVVSRVAFGWAVLWRCSFCGQLWEGTVAPGAGGKTDCVTKYYGNVDDWFDRRKADYDRFTRERRVARKAEQIAKEYERKGYEVKGEYGSTPWDQDIGWRYTLVCRKKGFLGMGESEINFHFVLTEAGDVLVDKSEW